MKRIVADRIKLSKHYMTETILLIFLALSALLISISIHESAHAWMANRLGDPTAKLLGRISFNPADHIDPVGTVLLPLTMLILGGPMIGWAKPTPFNPWNLQNPKRDSALISLAGPASNFALAIIFALPIRFGLVPFLNPFGIQNVDQVFTLLQPIEKLGFLMSGMIILNIMLGLFNLIPIHPLDGFKVVGGLLTKSLYYRWLEFERLGPFVLLTLLFFGGSVISIIITPIMVLILQLLVG
jgi:Zn-dependent protease